MIGRDSSLLNLVGHSTGALAFGIFLLLLTRDRAGARPPEGRLTLSAACLAFVWNLRALILNAISSKPSPPIQGQIQDQVYYARIDRQIFRGRRNKLHFCR